jgi:hypothetical protein
MKRHDLEKILLDIASQVKINPDFSLHHPEYKPLTIPEEAREKFFSLPLEMQHKYLSLQLRSFIYGLYYNRSLQKLLDPRETRHNLPEDLENNTVLGIDVAFYEQLHKSNCGQGNFDTGWQIIAQESPSSLIVSKKGLKLYVERDSHLQVADNNADVGSYVSIRMPKNRLQNGYYIAVGNAGFNLGTNIVRIYYNVFPQGTLGIMPALTKQLNQIEIPFLFKVLYNPQDYYRYDAGVLYLAKPDYHRLKDTLMAVYRENQDAFQVGTPLFTLKIAEGLGLAEEPSQQLSEQDSFGTHRCQLVANGLLQAWYRGETEPEAKVEHIFQQFIQLGLDLDRIYLNPDSEYIYD